MSVDYSANFGLGVEIDNDSFRDAVDAHDYDGMLVECVSELNGFSYDEFHRFHYGSEAYGGGENTICIVIKDPNLNNLKELERQKASLLAMLSSNGVKHGPFDVVGGLLIW